MGKKHKSVTLDEQHWDKLEQLKRDLKLKSYSDVMTHVLNFYEQSEDMNAYMRNVSKGVFEIFEKELSKITKQNSAIEKNTWRIQTMLNTLVAYQKWDVDVESILFPPDSKHTILSKKTEMEFDERMINQQEKMRG